MKWFKVILLVTVATNFLTASEKNERFYRAALGYLEKGNMEPATKALKALCRHKMQKACKKLKEISSPVASSMQTEIQHKSNTKDELTGNIVIEQKIKTEYNKHYTNERFGFSLVYPAELFVTKRLSDNGDGITLYNGDKSLELKAYGSRYGENIRDIYHDELGWAKDAGQKVTYKVLKRNWFVISGIERNKGKIFYQKTYFTDGKSTSFRLEYPIRDKAKYNSLVSTISKNFKTTNSMQTEIQHKSNMKTVQKRAALRKYEGAWFEIKYPGNFRVIPSIKSKTNVKGYDSVFFASPDKSIYFYIFAPQWNGKPKDILLNKKTEQKISCKKRKQDGVDYRYCTIQTKDGSYYKFYEDIEDRRINTRHVFGIIYQDRKVYNQYKSLYEQFKKSLVQFSN